jgi:hypothetical protein
MSKKSAINAVPFKKLKEVKRSLVNSGFYANSVALHPSGNTNLAGGKKGYFKNIFSVNRRLNNLLRNMEELKRPFRNTWINIKSFKRLGWSLGRLLLGWIALFFAEDMALSLYAVLP